MVGRMAALRGALNIVLDAKLNSLGKALINSLIIVIKVQPALDSTAARASTES